MTTSHALRAAAALLATLTLAGAAQAASPRSTLTATADAAIAAGVPGISIFVRDGSHTTLIARGYADAAAKRPLTTSDRFRIGSVTKSFVATVVMQLVAEGSLALDDSVDQHLPGLVPNGGAITIRQLLSHTSGLPDYFSNKKIIAPYFAGNHRYTWSHEQIVRISAKDKPIFAPGAAGRWSYSNTAYYTLGLIVEQVTGTSLESELARRIFRPLGLGNTTLPTTAQIPGRHAHGYSKYFGKLADVTTFSPSIIWAAGGIVSTPSDVATFYRALLQGRLLPLPLVHQMTTKVALIAGPSHPKLVYGLGLYSQPLSCGTSWGHNGDFAGYHMDAFNSPDGKRQVIVSVNEDADLTIPPAAGAPLRRLLEQAFCG
jgi:D-alanyl-D-alanine carboxypeptidase